MNKSSKTKQETLSAGNSKLVSFGFGTIEQAFADRTIGGINYGHNEDIVTGHDFGCQYMEGMLISSRVLDITVGDANEVGETPVRVLYVDEGQVKSENFVTVDKNLVDTLISAAKEQIDASIDGIDAAVGELAIAVDEIETKFADIRAYVPAYEGSEYIRIAPDGSNYVVSVKYDELLGAARETLGIDTIDASLATLDERYIVLTELVDEKADATETAEHFAMVDSSIETIENDIVEINETLDKFTNGTWIDASSLLPQPNENDEAEG